MTPESCTQSRELLLDIADEFLEAANIELEDEDTKRALLALRRRAALKLVPVPKMGYEHLLFNPGP